MSLPHQMGSRNPYRERHFQIAEATHQDDGSVNLRLKNDGLEYDGAFESYPPEDHIETRRLGKKSLILTRVELVVDGEAYAGHGYTVEEHDLVVGGMLFASRQREIGDDVAAAEVTS